MSEVSRHIINIEELAFSRPSANHRLEQFLMKPEELTKQADNVGPFLSDKRVFFLGDDDHISPILSTRFNVHPIVFEVDPRIRDNLSAWFDRPGISGEISDYDARLPIESSPLCESFYINPPFSSKSGGLGIKIWLMRALEACQPTANGVIVMPWDGGNINQSWVDEVQCSVVEFIGNNGCDILRIDWNTASYFDTTHEDLRSSNVYIQRVDASKNQSVDIAGMYN